MQLLGRDAYFGTEPEACPVGEARGNVHVYSSSIDARREGVRGVFPVFGRRVCNDAFAMARAVAIDVLDRLF